MSKVIFKYNLNDDKFITNITTNKGAKILDIQIQYEDTVIWMLVDPNKEIVTRQIHTKVTGVPTDTLDSLQYIKTLQYYDNLVVTVLHYFDAGEI